MDAEVVEKAGLIDRCLETLEQQDTTLQFLSGMIGMEQEKSNGTEAPCAMDALSNIIDNMQYNAGQIRHAVELIHRRLYG